jgi:hypothetical protein
MYGPSIMGTAPRVLESLALQNIIIKPFDTIFVTRGQKTLAYVVVMLVEFDSNPLVVIKNRGYAKKIERKYSAVDLKNKKSGVILDTKVPDPLSS